MSTPSSAITTYRILIVGDDSTKEVREQIAQNINEKQKESIPNGATAHAFFESSKDLVSAMMASSTPSFIVTVQTPESYAKSSSSTSSSSLNNSHSLRYWWVPTSGASVEEAVEVITSSLKNKMERLRPTFTSSRGGAADAAGKKEVSFLSAIREGLAQDGGLFTPKTLPKIPQSQLAAIFSIPSFSKKYSDLALAVLEQLVDVNEVPPGILKEMIDTAYKPESWPSAQNVTLPVSKTENIVSSSSSCYIAELYHGPTAAFKDFALQLFPHLFAASIVDHGDEAEEEGSSSSSSSKYMILAATSGDTGVSAIRGFMNGAPHVKVMVLYPKNGVSPVQRQQMLSFHGGNVRVVGVDGDFDFCQSTVKAIFNNREVNAKLEKEMGTKLSSANSINWGRLLPQIVYYFWIYAQVLLQEGSSATAAAKPMDVVVPTGNFGNILSGFFAKQLGVPIRKFVLASNQNDVLNEFIKTGTYDISKRSLQVTASPSIDILKASNVERYLYYVSNHNAELVAKLMKQLDTEKKFTVPPEVFAKMQEEFVAYKCTEKECAEEIQFTAKNTPSNTMIDPHTGVAVKALKMYNADKPCDVPVVVVSTAHWAKFPDCVQHALESASFPAPAETNNLPSEKVMDIFNAVTSNVEDSFVAIPLKKTFENLGKAEVMTSDKSVDEIIEKVYKFAQK